MLVLSRKRDESLIITNQKTGEKIKILVVEQRGDKVRLGVEAPNTYTIHREEVQEKVDAKAEQEIHVCPICGGRIISMARCRNGDSECIHGHMFPTKDAKIIRYIKYRCTSCLALLLAESTASDVQCPGCRSNGNVVRITPENPHGI